MPAGASPLEAAVIVFFSALELMLLVRIILSWFAVGRNNRLVELLFAFTEPILAPIRNLVSRSPLGGPGMVLDFSPLIAFVLLRLLMGVILSFI